MEFGQSSALPAGSAGSGRLFGPGGEFVGRPTTQAEQAAADREASAAASALENKIAEIADGLSSAFSSGPYATLMSSSAAARAGRGGRRDRRRNRAGGRRRAALDRSGARADQQAGWAQPGSRSAIGTPGYIAEERKGAHSPGSDPLFHSGRSGDAWLEADDSAGASAPSSATGFGRGHGESAGSYSASFGGSRGLFEGGADGRGASRDWLRSRASLSGAGSRAGAGGGTGGGTGPGHAHDADGFLGEGSSAQRPASVLARDADRAVASSRAAARWGSAGMSGPPPDSAGDWHPHGQGLAYGRDGGSVLGSAADSRGSLPAANSSAGEDVGRMVAEHVFRGRRGAALDASDAVTRAANRALLRSSGRGAGSASSSVLAASAVGRGPAPAGSVPGPAAASSSSRGLGAGAGGASAPVLPRARDGGKASLSGGGGAAKDRVGGLSSGRSGAGAGSSVPGTGRSTARRKLGRSRLKQTGKPATVEDMAGTSHMPRGAALARAAALASNSISVSGLPRPANSGFDADALQSQNVRAVGAHMRRFQREMMDLKTGGFGGGKPRGILDPAVDQLLASLPPLQAPGVEPKLDKMSGLPPRLLGAKLTPLEEERQKARLSRPAADGPGATGAGAGAGVGAGGGAGAGQRSPCALCQFPFARVNLVTPVTRKAVFTLIGKWGADPAETFGAAAAARLRLPPACYEVVRVCRFCTQFFDAAVEEAQRGQLTADADSTMA
mmetsp:Transcript_297/g.963  ORF Transcript_297/g.963 Transcript_297/m.963 type:complete len:729 (-) Transcript_297:138-2324(-)